MAASIFRVKAGLYVDGNITLSGTVDTVDIATFKTTFDNHNHNLADLTEKSYSSLTDKPTVGNGSFTEINFTTALNNKLSGIDTSADVTDATTVNAAGAVMESDYGDNQILFKNNSSAMTALTIAEQRLVGRITSGEVTALTAAQIRTLINVENNADVTDATNVNSSGAVMESDFNATTFLYATSDNTPQPKTPSDVRTILNVADGANNYSHPNHTGEVTSTGDGATVVADNVIDADNLMGNSAVLGDGTDGYALVAGSVAGRFAWHGFGTAADSATTTSIDTSSNLPTSNAVKTYVDNIASGLGNVIAPVADLAALKTLVNATDMDDRDMVLVESLGLYRYDAQASDTANDNTIVAPTTGGGRWFKISSTINEHANLDGIDKWNGTAANTYHVPNVDSNSAHFLDGTGSWSTPSGTYTHPNHTGDVTSIGDGATTIAAGVVTNAKLANMAQNTIKGRITASTGSPEDLTAANIRTIINVSDGANNYVHHTQSTFALTTSGATVIGDLTVNNEGHTTTLTSRTLTLADLGYTGTTDANTYVHPDHTGDVTSTGDGATAIANGKITEGKLQSNGGGTLSGGGSGDVLKWDTGGTFQWGSAATPTEVAYTYGDSTSVRVTSVGTSQTTIDTLAYANVRSISWMVSVNDVTNSRYETLFITAVHDGSTVWYNEYGNVHTTTSPGVAFDVAIVSTNIVLRATGTSVNNTITAIRSNIDS